MSEVLSKYDYIIVGGGSAGAVLATRLSENPALDILLLEAGSKDTNPLIHIPFGLSLLSRFEGIGWGYHTAPQKEMYDRELFWPRGKTLGGSSSVNAMCYIRGQKKTTTAGLMKKGLKVGRLMMYCLISNALRTLKKVLMNTMAQAAHSMLASLGIPACCQTHL